MSDAPGRQLHGARRLPRVDPRPAPVLSTAAAFPTNAPASAAPADALAQRSRLTRPAPRNPPAGGPYTGASLNPARTIGPACVFACSSASITSLYVAAQLFGGLCAAAVATCLYGRTPAVQRSSWPHGHQETL